MFSASAAAHTAARGCGSWQAAFAQGRRSAVWLKPAAIRNAAWSNIEPLHPSRTSFGTSEHTARGAWSDVQVLWACFFEKKGTESASKSLLLLLYVRRGSLSTSKTAPAARSSTRDCAGWPNTFLPEEKRGSFFFGGYLGRSLGSTSTARPSVQRRLRGERQNKEQALQGILSSSDNIKMGHHARPPAKSATPVERAVASAPCSPQRSEYAACEAAWRPAPSRALRETPRPYGGSAALSAPPTLSKRKLSWSSLFSDQAGRPSSSRRISGGCA